MKQILTCLFLVLSLFTFSQNIKVIKFESDTLVRGFHFPFKITAPNKFDSLILQTEGCSGRLVSDSIGFVFADSLSNSCRVSLFKMIDNDTVFYGVKDLVIEDIDIPKLLIGGIDVVEVNKEIIKFKDFKFGLHNITQPKLLFINFAISKVNLTLNGIEKSYSFYEFEKLEDIFINSKKGDVIFIKTLTYLDPTKGKRFQISVNKKITRVNSCKSKYKFFID